MFASISKGLKKLIWRIQKKTRKKKKANKQMLLNISVLESCTDFTGGNPCVYWRHLCEAQADKAIVQYRFLVATAESRATYLLTIVCACLFACLLVDSYANYWHQVAHSTVISAVYTRWHWCLFQLLGPGGSLYFVTSPISLTFELFSGNSGFAWLTSYLTRSSEESKKPDKWLKDMIKDY